MMLGCGLVYLLCLLFFFFKQKTAYEMRISDWSSDVCSSDLATADAVDGVAGMAAQPDAEVRVAAVAAQHHVERVSFCCGHHATLAVLHQQQIGRASCRERVCQYV